MKPTSTQRINRSPSLFSPNLAVALLASLTVGGLLSTGYSQPTPNFTEDFETGNLSRWTQMTTTPLTISPSGTNIAPVGGNYAALYPSSASKMRAGLTSPITDKFDSCRASVWIYDYSVASALTNRAIFELRSCPTGAFASSSSYNQILAIGIYNSWTVTPSTNSKYSGRVVSGTPGGWFTLNNAPDRSVGWHHFAIERGTNGAGQVLLKYFQDEILGAVYTNVTSFALSNWDTVLFGLGAGSSAGAAYLDGVEVVQGQAFIGDEPQSTTNLVGSYATLSAGAYGSAGALSYWWFKDGVLLKDDSHIYGSDSSSLSIYNLQSSDSGWYSVMVSNAWGVRTSAVPARLQVAGINLSIQPTNQIVNLGSNDVSFYVEAAGVGNVYYQWQKDGVSIPGATGMGSSSTYTIATVQASDLATTPGYTCLFTNDLGDRVLSAAATLRSNAPPSLLAIGNLTTLPGTNIAISLTVTDDFSSKGLFQTFEASAVGSTVMFRAPSYSGTTTPPYVSGTNAFSYVTNANLPAGNALAGTNVLYVTCNFTNTSIAGWDRLTTAGFNPIVSFSGPLKFDICTDRPMGVAVALRETNPTGNLGQDGGGNGPIELAGVSQGGTPPVPIFITPANGWTNLQFDLTDPTWAWNYIQPSGLISGNNGGLDSTTGKGVIECLALTPADGLGTYKIYMDNFQSVPLNYLKFSLDSAPEGATIDPYSGFIQWAVPTTTGSFNFTVRVTDHLGLTDTKSFTVTASTAPAREALRYAFVNNQLVLSWTNPAFTLATATDAAGPFTRISGATSPYTNAVTSTTKFFRLMWP